jgi:hypothetical protein
VRPTHALDDGSGSHEGLDQLKLTEHDAENRDGGTPCEISYSAIGRLPMWEAALRPSPSHRSPNPRPFPKSLTRADQLFDPL